MGALLGAADASLKTGLEFPLGDHHIPLDATAALVALGGSVIFAKEEMAPDLRNAGSAAAAVFAYRKTHDYMSERMAAEGKTPGSIAAKTAIAGESAYGFEPQSNFGNEDVDPIVAAARAMSR
jgi:hypothetical protein